jgi:hypothetical protein
MIAGMETMVYVPHSVRVNRLSGRRSGTAILLSRPAGTPVSPSAPSVPPPRRSDTPPDPKIEGPIFPQAYLDWVVGKSKPSS